jgi:hypothetical protein
VTFMPAPWPSVKDLVVSVNRVQVTASWRRAWPARKHEMIKSYLALDVTTQIQPRNGGSQTISFDCFDKEYYAMVVVAIARPVAESVVAQEVRQHAAQPGSFASFQTSKALYDLYRETLVESMATDDEVRVDTSASTVSLKCPVTQLRTRVPARGARCTHLQCFDLEGAVRNCHTACYWCCPLCDKPMTSADLVIDPYIEQVLHSASPSVKAVRLAPTPGNPFNWLTAISEDDGEAYTEERRAAAAGMNRTADSLDDLLASSDDDGDRQPQRSNNTGVLGRSSKKSTGTVADPISID